MKRYLAGFLLICGTLIAQTPEPKTSDEAIKQHLQIMSDLANTRAELEKNPLFVHWLALQGEKSKNEFAQSSLASAELAAKRKIAQDAMVKSLSDRDKARMLCLKNNNCPAQ